MNITLLKPSLTYLPHYTKALEQGWSHDNIMGIERTQEELAKIQSNPEKFVEFLDDQEARGDPITLPDGTIMPRLPGFHRWIWDGEFCGSMKFRWQPGTSELPPYVLGHIGYGIVPWKQGKGYATQALGLFLREVRKPGLTYVEITTDPDNIASQRVVTANGGVLVGRFQKAAVYGDKKESLRFRIML